jgi:hypothetical protein
VKGTKGERPAQPGSESGGKRRGKQRGTWDPGYRKVTLLLPGDLLDKATAATGKGITPTIREGLRLVSASEAFARLRALRGKVKLSLDLTTLRED